MNRSCSRLAQEGLHCSTDSEGNVQTGWLQVVAIVDREGGVVITQLSGILEWPQVDTDSEGKVVIAQRQQGKETITQQTGFCALGAGRHRQQGS